MYVCMITVCLTLKLAKPDTLVTSQTTYEPTVVKGPQITKTTKTIISRYLL